MSFTHTFPVNVEFGDCDPAQIVWYPNFFRWMDAAGRHFFIAAGVPLWHELEKTTGIIGTPIVDAQTRFLRPASYGDRLEIDSEVTEWRSKSFVMRHRVRRGADLLVECTEVRVFAQRVEGDPRRIRAAAVPADIRALCGGPVADEVDGAAGSISTTGKVASNDTTGAATGNDTGGAAASNDAASAAASNERNPA